MQERGALATVAVGLLACAVVLLAILVFQSDTLEERLILQTKQLRALGEATDRVAARVDRLASTGAVVAGGQRPSARDEYADVQVLHPEVPNLLEEDPFTYENFDVPQDRTLQLGWPYGDPATFNPLTGNAAEVSNGVEHYVQSSIAGRMRFTDPSRYAGDLAWRVEVTNDSKELTVYLRHGVMWHKPGNIDLEDPLYAWLAGDHEVTASDLVFMFDMLMHPQVENGFVKNLYSDIDSWEALDDYTFVVRWKKSLYTNIGNSIQIGPLPEFLYAYDEAGVRFPDETLGLRFNQHWYSNKGSVGSGPYRMVTYEQGVKIELERNEDFYGDKPPIRRIVYSIYTDANRTLLMLKAGELHAGSVRPSEYREEVLRWKGVPESERPEDSPFLNGDIQCEQFLRLAYFYIGWNGDLPIFADRRVRKAMTLASNRRGVIDEIYLGLGEIAPGPFLSTGPLNAPDVVPLAFDLDAARAELAAAGWIDSDGDGLLDKDLDGDGERDPFEFSFMIGSSIPEVAAMANVYKEDLLKIGVRMTIEAAEWSLRQKRMDEKEFDAYYGGWGMGWESDPYQLWHSSQADAPKGSNKVGFRRPDVDRLIEDLRATFDTEERIEKYRAIHRAIDEEQAYTFFIVPKRVYCWWSDLRGVRFADVRPKIDTLPWWIEDS